MSRYYSRRHYDSLSNGGPDTPERIAERIAHRAVCEQAHREMLERFAPLTPTNVKEAIDWQSERIEALKRK